MPIEKSQAPAKHAVSAADDPIRIIQQTAESFSSIDDAGLDALMHRIGDARIVLIGEASHGTSEFYRMRQRITRELIERKGFTIIAAEADWPSAEYLDEYVRGRPEKPERARDAFSRFPDWMWRNHEVLDFTVWLRAHNTNLTDADRAVAFYGLDLYSLYSSIDEVLAYLRKTDPDLAELARRRYECLAPFRTDPSRYGSEVVMRRYEECQDEVSAMLTDLLKRRVEFAASRDGRAFLDASQNARVVANAERYYKLMYLCAPDSWNLRDSHMFETLKQVMDFHGSTSKAVVWAHNSHVGDAGATSMAARGETNIGQLVRESYRGLTYTIGFGTHTGTVAAASSWGGPVEIKEVRPSHPESIEYLCHHAGAERFFLPLHNPKIREVLGEPHLERAIGVVYRPETELQSHYFKAVLPEQFDEYAWFNETEAVRPFEHTRAPSLSDRHPFLLAD